MKRYSLCQESDMLKVEKRMERRRKLLSEKCTELGLDVIARPKAGYLKNCRKRSHDSAYRRELIPLALPKADDDDRKRSLNMTFY
ncbi:hypothetical protein EVAR_73199_1 [Eumeta japonica]|uniref:Uncharacterized protein n=1 Tax=Eumeta variegata TaxID=151549 RepID=A0A4C1T8R1_EUMVA|nr:hypothetical protein EVAR_73199_1 [Eumeta japonica]